MAELPPDRAEELRALVLENGLPARVGLPCSATDEECGRRALELATTWLAFLNDPRSTPAQVRVASVVRDSYTLLWGATSR